jgi:tetratricopeptide (TPR) repeat protein/predicted Ser/Thr protein kinase
VVSSDRPATDGSTVEQPRWSEDSPRRAAEQERAFLRERARQLLFGGPDTPMRLGRLELVERIGAGGMGEVWAAHDPELDRRVAVKIVRPDFAADSADATLRFVREAQAMARVTHPNVVRIYDVGRVDARVYITMEFVEGTTLAAWLRETPRPWREVLARFLRAGRGLAAAHAMGIVHRDFKPSNVLVGADGRVLVADFGLARSVAADPVDPVGSSAAPRPGASGSGPSLPAVTEHGAVIGTPGYMAPEQIRAAPVDARSDLFSFCVALYEGLYGVRPFLGPTPAAMLRAIEAGRPTTPLRSAGVPERIHRVLTRGLAADPARRWPTMDALLAAIERALVRPRRIAAVGVAAVTAAITAGAAADLGPFADPDPCAGVGAGFAAAWDDERAAALRERFVATGPAFAAAAAERVIVRLDAYAAAGAAASVEACEATQVRHARSPGLADLQLACLRRREAALASLVDTLQAADRTTVEKAVDSVAALPAVAACADAEALLRAVRPPEDPVEAAAAARARALLGRAEAQRATGHPREGLSLADAALGLLAEVADEPVRAEALALRGRLLQQLGEFVAAEAALLDACELAEGSRHDELAADVWLALMRLANQSLSDAGRGTAWIPRARAAQRRLGDPAARRVAVLLEEGSLRLLEHRYAEAEQALLAAQDIEAAHDADALLLARASNSLAHTYEATHRFPEARVAYERALGRLEAALGPDHPEYAMILHDFGTFLTAAGELGPARARLTAALGIFTRAYGEAHPLAGRAHIAMVQLALQSGEFADAVAHAEAAARIYRETLPPGHNDHVAAALAQGTARFFAGELEGALAAFLAARALQRELTAADPLITAMIAVDLGETQVAMARWDEARESFAEVERTLAAADLTDADLSARVLTGRGQIALAAGDAPAALRLLEDALALRRRLPDDPLALAELQAALDRARAAARLQPRARGATLPTQEPPR